MAKPDGSILKQFTYQDLSLPPRQAAMDKRGRIWVTGINGIALIDGENITLMNPDSLLASYLITRDNKGDLWFTAKNHLYKYENDTIRLMHHFE
jgi:ligand-binding sensor domain-containing protein